MKQSSIKRILIPIMLVLTLTAMLVCVSAAETTETVQNPTAKLTVTSVKTGETIETLYEIAEAAFYAAEQEAQSHDKTVTVTLLAPQKGYTFACGLSYFTSPITVDLGGFHHYIKHFSISGQSTLTIKNGTVTTAGPHSSDLFGININHPQLTVILEKDVTVHGADRNTMIHAEGAEDVIMEFVGTIPMRVMNGALVNHGTIIGGTSATAVQNDGGEIYNHGTIRGGDGFANNPAYTFDGGCGVNGYNGVTLNTGIIRSGNVTVTAPTDEQIMSGPAVYGIVKENTGSIIGGSVTANSANVTPGPGVYGAVGLNTGTIRSGDAHSTAKEGQVIGSSAVIGWQTLNAADYGYSDDITVYAVILENRGTITTGKLSADAEGVIIEDYPTVMSRGDSSYEVLYNSGEIIAVGGANAFDESFSGRIVYENTGIITPIALTQTDLNIFIDGTKIDPMAPSRFYDGKEHTLAYTLTFGGKDVTFDGVTDALTLDGTEVSALNQAGSYRLAVSLGDQTKTYYIDIQPDHPFNDITEDHPYYADIAGVYQKGLMNGTEPNVFSPDTTLSRAMLVTMLWRMEGQPVVNYAMQFSDVAEEDWYAEAIRWAAAEGLVLGYDDGTFGVNNPITLEQMAVILYRYEQYKGGGFTGMWMFRLNYDDIADISEWAYEAVCYMVMKGVYCAPTETTLQPQKSATRAEAAGFLNRYADYRASLISEVQ